MSTSDREPRPGASNSTGAPVTAVLRTADVLSYLATSPTRPVGVTEIATALQLSKAVVFRILASLLDRGYVEFDAQSRRYLLGPRSLSLGMAYLERADVRQPAHDALVKLSARSGETATLSLRTGWERMYVDQVLPVDDIKMVVTIGRPFPLHAGASSKAFLAFLAGEEQDRFFAEHRSLETLTEATIVDETALRTELAEIRERGYAESRGERQPGAGSVAAPIFDRGGLPAAVVSVCGPVVRFEDRRADAAQMLMAETERLSQQARRSPTGLLS
jgi:DNA-binding IclR family transcriptional regulator